MLLREIDIVKLFLKTILMELNSAQNLLLCDVLQTIADGTGWQSGIPRSRGSGLELHQRVSTLFMGKKIVPNCDKRIKASKCLKLHLSMPVI